jgi:hypothetical protein
LPLKLQKDDNITLRNLNPVDGENMCKDMVQTTILHLTENTNKNNATNTDIDVPP